ARLNNRAGDDAAQNVNFAIRGSVLRLFLQSRGVPFQSAESAPAAAVTADLADLVSRSVVQILCHGSTPTPPTATAEPSPAPAYSPPPRAFKTVESYDVIGFDYGMLRDVGEYQCQAACSADRGCQALTYNKSART